jgi:hypothetical protein
VAGPELTDRAHGTRGTYKAGCRCTPCRAANAAYWSAWRAQRLTGRAPLGSLVSAVEAQRLIRQLLGERFAKTTLARALGQASHLRRLQTAELITLRTALRVRRFYRLAVGETRHGLDSSRVQQLTPAQAAEALQILNELGRDGALEKE